MTTVTYTGSARAFSTAAYDGISVERGGTVDVTEEAANFLLENHDFEEVSADESVDEDDEPDAQFSVLDQNIPDVEDALDSGNFDDQLDALETAEADGKERAGVFDAIEERRNAAEG